MVTKVLVGVLKAAFVAATFYVLLNPASFLWAGATLAVSTHNVSLLMSIVSAVTLSYGYSAYTLVDAFHKIRNHFKPQKPEDVLHFAPGMRANVSSFDGYEAE